MFSVTCKLPSVTTGAGGVTPAPTAIIPLCNDGCFGPGAVCNRGVCTCSRGYSRIGTNQCVVAGAPLPTAPPNAAPSPCQVGAFGEQITYIFLYGIKSVFLNVYLSFALAFSTACSSICEAGVRSQRQYITKRSVGSGSACPSENCGTQCHEEAVACNGATLNTGICSTVPKDRVGWYFMGSEIIRDSILNLLFAGFYLFKK